MVDAVMEIDRLPHSGGDVYAKSQTMTVGGCGFNVADILRHFNADYDFLCPIGTGFYATIAAQALQKHGHKRLIYDTSMDNGYCLCLVDNTGERTFVTLAGIECCFKKEWFEPIAGESYTSAYVSGYEIEGSGGRHIIDYLTDRSGIQIFYAPGPRIQHIETERHNRIFRLHPVLHVNEQEALSFTGEKDYQAAAKKLYQYTEQAVIITLGSKGCYVYDGTEYFAAAAAAKTVDTTGAGDAHIGTIIALYMMQNAEWQRTLVMANTVSAAVVAVKGATLTHKEFGGIQWEK